MAGKPPKTPSETRARAIDRRSFLAALTAWAYNAGQVTVAERVDAPGVILHDEEG